MIDHLKRKNPCPCTFSDMTREEAIIVSFSRQCHYCIHCNKIFMSTKCLDNHSIKCAKNPINDVTPSQSNIVNTLNTNGNNNTTLNNSTIDNSIKNNDNSINKTVNAINPVINNSKITINNFGSEDRSYITKETLHECIDTARVVPLIMDVYFNSDHPENHTIKLKSEKLSRVIVHMEGKWIECDMNSSIDSMMQLERNSMTNYYWTDVSPNITVADKTKLVALESISEFCKTGLKYFEERRKVHAILKNIKAGMGTLSPHPLPKGL